MGIIFVTNPHFWTKCDSCTDRERDITIMTVRRRKNSASPSIFLLFLITFALIYHLQRVPGTALRRYALAILLLSHRFLFRDIGGLRSSPETVLKQKFGAFGMSGFPLSKNGNQKWIVELYH